MSFQVYDRLQESMNIHDMRQHKVLISEEMWLYEAVNIHYLCRCRCTIGCKSR